MNRNVQVLALGACVLASLGVAWWATSGGQQARTPPEWAEVERSTSDGEQEYAHALEFEEPVQEAIESDASSGKDRRVAAEPVGVPRLVSGMVRDGDGGPVEDAQIVVTDSPIVRLLGAGGVLASGSSDAQGRFEIHATVPPFQLFVRASKGGFLESNPKDFLRGAEGVQLVLQGRGVVSGQLLLDPWVATDRITLGIKVASDERGKVPSGLTFASNRPVADGAIDSAPRSIQFKIDAEGHFAVGGFAAPSVAVTVQPLGDPAQILEIRDVAVHRAGAAPDPRIDPIDLRGKFQRIAVDVIDDAGVKRDGARVALGGAGRPEGDRTQFTRDGRAEFLVWSGAHDVDVSLQGFRTVRLSAVEGDQVVQLRPGIQIQVTLRGSAARPLPPDLLAVALMKGTRTRPVLDGIGAFQDPFRTTFVVASPGPHEVGWYLERGPIQAYLETGTTQTVDVRDQEAIQEIVVDLPASAEAAWADRVRTFEQSQAEARQRAEEQQRAKVEFERSLRDQKADVPRDNAPEPK